MKRSIVFILFFVGCIFGVISSTEAIAAEVEYTITFDPDNGTDYSTWFKTQVEHGGRVTEVPADPEKAGHTFLGWYHTLDEEDNPIFWNFSDNEVTDNTTLWAAYRQNHTVTFDPDNGSSYPDWFKTQVTDGGLITEIPTEPEKVGYTFLGWYHALDEEDNPIFWNFSENQVTENTTLWAAYTQMHTVTFDPEDGTDYSMWFKTQVEHGGKVTEVPVDPEKAGYTFLGWYHALDEEDNPIFWNFSDNEVTDNTTLWAAYDRVYLVTFDPQNGIPESEWLKLSIVSGSKINETILEPTKEGYHFIGWSKVAKESELWAFSLDIVTEDRILYAIWEKDEEAELEEQTETMPIKETKQSGQPEKSLDKSIKIAKETPAQLPNTGTTESPFHVFFLGFFLIFSSSFIYIKQ